MIRRILLLSFFTLLTTNIVAQGNTADPIVDLGYGRYRGSFNSTTGLKEFYGLPFAQPPVGSLRWKAPLPISPSQNNTGIVVNATGPAPRCVQGYPIWAAGNITQPDGVEDCLILNVLQPANNTESKLPVVVMIHGGGYTVGDAITGDAHALMRHSRNGFVFVSLQYRLGAYGFLGSKKFISEGGVPNIGLLDQRLALEWVQDHICKFNGDPKKVTIMGGSAGGGSVTSQMTMHGGVENPPFRAAVAEFPWWQQHLTDDQLERQYNYLLEAANCSSLSCLQGLPDPVLAAATQATYFKGYAEGAYGHGHFYYGPYVDGSIIRDLPSREFAAGHFTKIPMLTDRDMYEGFSFSNQSLTTLEEEKTDLGIQFPRADEKFVEKLFELYPSNDFNATFWQRQTWFGDFSINCPTRYIASSLSSLDIPIYKMVFNAGSQLHGATGPFLADPWTLPFPAPGYNETLAQIMKDWWVSFALHSDPNAQSFITVPKPHWPLYKEGEEVMSVNYTEIGAVNDEYFDKNARCDFFRGESDVVQN